MFSLHIWTLRKVFCCSFTLTLSPTKACPYKRFDQIRPLLQNMDDNLNSSKRLIQLAAEAQFGGRFDVICANGDFSYVTNTELFCQESKGDVSCYTYRQLWASLSIEIFVNPFIDWDNCEPIYQLSLRKAGEAKLDYSKSWIVSKYRNRTDDLPGEFVKV